MITNNNPSLLWQLTKNYTAQKVSKAGRDFSIDSANLAGRHSAKYMSMQR
jgi:hypothetical protein